MIQTKLDNRGAAYERPYGARRSYQEKPVINTYITRADSDGVEFKTMQKIGSAFVETAAGFISFDDVRTASRRRNLVRAMTRGSQAIFIVGRDTRAYLEEVMAAAKSAIGLKSQSVVTI
ncbi:MAG: hypothetical protein F4X94_01425 [Dehalococcoidia bacterium]|nr:hypothetical protein [Dehalococcoidia bacterium]